LKQAAQWLERGSRLADVTELSGYASTRAFGRAFKRQFGLCPSDWRAKRAAPIGGPSFDLVRLDHDVPCHTLRMAGKPQEVSRCHEPCFASQRERTMTTANHLGGSFIAANR
jgi:hypothetical protein